MSIKCGDCLEVMSKMKDRSVDLVIGSPPYAGKGERYGTRQKWDTQAWIDWMVAVTRESARVSRNAVVWVVNGFVRDGRYNPAVEGLIYELFQRGYNCERPCIWHKNAPPNRKDWFGNDWEFVVAIRADEPTRYFDWEAIAEAPKYSNGGDFRQRGTNGERRKGGSYPKGKLARPRDVFRVTVGGGHLGSKLAHENEAPFPEKIVEPFVKCLCPPGGTVLDPFSGSGTTPAVAIKHGRKFIAIDCRKDQCDLTRRRVAEVRREFKDTRRTDSNGKS